MNEIEVRILNIDSELIKEKLNRLGAKLVKNEFQINHIYDFPGDTLREKQKGYCRIREVENLLDGSKKYILCVKKMISQNKYKEMLEEETEILDFQAMKNILIELGLYNRFTSKKKRESYDLNGVLYEFDEQEKDVFPIPYLEIEAMDEESLKRGVEVLGYTLEDTTSKTLSELRKELGINKSIL